MIKQSRELMYCLEIVVVMGTSRTAHVVFDPIESIRFNLRPCWLCDGGILVVMLRISS